MKEQIAELANECGFDVDKTGTFGNYSEMHRLEKFTELIVRECARIADRKYLYSKEPNRWDSGFNISCEILEQFGILKDE